MLPIMKKIECPNGTLSFHPDIIKDSIYIKNSLLDTIFNIKKENIIYLTYDIDYAKAIIDIINDGTFYIPKDHIIFKYITMINYLAGSNSLLEELYLQLTKGKLDIVKHDIISKSFDLKEYPIVMHYDKDIRHSRIMLLSNLIDNYLSKTYKKNITEIDLIEMYNIDTKYLDEIYNKFKSDPDTQSDEWDFGLLLFDESGTFRNLIRTDWSNIQKIYFDKLKNYE